MLYTETTYLVRSIYRTMKGRLGYKLPYLIAHIVNRNDSIFDYFENVCSSIFQIP